MTIFAEGNVPACVPLTTMFPLAWSSARGLRYAGVCSSDFTVEGDGCVYPCDFYVLDRYRMGSVLEDSFAAMAGSEAAVRFVEESKPVDSSCQSCGYFPFCRGGCRRYREPFVDGRRASTSSVLHIGNFSITPCRVCSVWRPFSPVGRGKQSTIGAKGKNRTGEISRFGFCCS